MVPALVLALVVAHSPAAARESATTRYQQGAAGVQDAAVAVAEARKLIAADKPRDAIATLQAIADPSPEVRYLLGVAYYHADDYAHAIEQLSAIRTSLPEGSFERREATQVLGLSLYVSKRYPDAIPLLEETRAWASDNLSSATSLVRPTSRCASQSGLAPPWRGRSGWRRSRPRRMSLPRNSCCGWKWSRKPRPN